MVNVPPLVFGCLPPYCLSQSLWQRVYCLLCDDDGPDMFDMADAESISDGDAADLLDIEEDADGDADAAGLVNTAQGEG